MFDRDLILDKLNSLHHQAKNLLLRFKARVIERCADITTKLLWEIMAKADRWSQEVGWEPCPSDA
jgi:hypothetical protein